MRLRHTRRFLVGGGVSVALCLSLLLVAAAAWAAAGWNPQSSGTQNALGAVAFASPLDGWAVGAAGAIVHTSDGGAVWAAESATPASTQNLAGVAFVNASVGWAVGAAGTILHTTDGGADWSAQSATPASTQDLAGVAFVNASVGWAVGASGTILHTTDGGADWAAQSATPASTQNLTAVAFADADNGWAVGAAGTILHTTDGGAVWTPQGAGATQQNLARVAFANASVGWAVGAAGTILHTADGGADWTAQAVGATQQNLAGVTFADADSGWVVGAAGTILHTSDAGAVWSLQAAGTVADLSAVVFPSATRGWVVGAGGTVLETVSAGIPDTTAPVTTATGLQINGRSGWRNKAQTVTLAGADGGSGVAATYFVLDHGARHTYTGPFVLAAAGSHSVSYWSVDVAGNVEVAHGGYVNIDSGRPVCLATADVVARRGALVKLSFRVRDPKPSCGKATVTIKIYRGRTVVKTIRLSGVPVNSRRLADYRVNLARGTYTWVVSARDLAGNVQSRVGRRHLQVVSWVIASTADVQRCLAALGYLPAHGAVSGRDDYRTEQALLAFQAWNGLSRDGLDGRNTRAVLENASRPTPRPESATGNYAEVFRSLGVLLCVNGGRVVRVVHCSTGRPSLPTPAGRFSIYLKSLDWWSTQYHDWMPFASFFSGGDGIHGYPDVPAYPASHGCVRISMPEAPWVFSFMNYGAAVFVY